MASFPNPRSPPSMRGRFAAPVPLPARVHPEELDRLGRPLRSSRAEAQALLRDPGARDPGAGAGAGGVLGEGPSLSSVGQAVLWASCSPHYLCLQLHSHSRSLPSALLVHSVCSTGGEASGYMALQSLVFEHRAMVHMHQPPMSALAVHALHTGLQVPPPVILEYARGEAYSGWLTKWPMNDKFGQSKRRYFTLHGSVLSYYISPPLHYERIAQSPYTLHHKALTENANSLGSSMGSFTNVSSLPSDNLLIRNLHLTEDTVLTKARQQLLYPCYSIK
jgi:hypothetical protein